MFAFLRRHYQEWREALAKERTRREERARFEGLPEDEKFRMKVRAALRGEIQPMIVPGE